MNWKNGILALGLGAALLPAQAAIAADHLDGAAVKTDPTTDINDVYSWMSADGTKVYLAMTVFPAATTAAKFSNAAYYVFHTASRADFLNQTMVPKDIICSFDATQKISCWFGDSTNFVYGDASATTGLTGLGGKVKIFAGLRKDHFFFNLDGFNNARATIKQRNMTTPITLGANGCPNNISMAEQTLIVNQLKTSMATGMGAPTNFFANLNTLAIVLEVDKTMLNGGGPILSVWGATVKKN
jgi:hypothetical protein